MRAIQRLALLLMLCGLAFLACSRGVRGTYSASGPDIIDTIPVEENLTLVGAEFQIILEANWSTGYSWWVADPFSTSVVTFVSREYVPLPNPDTTILLGRAGHEYWTFRVRATGSASALFRYTPAWDSTNIVDSFRFAIKVGA